jgi:hypothetical protein
MAIRTSTTRSDGSCAIVEQAERATPRMALPVDPDFRPAAPTVSLNTMVERSADLRRWLPKGIPTDGDRLAAKCDKSFVLERENSAAAKSLD